MNRNVLLLGLASLINDVSSEMIAVVLRLFIMELGGGGVVLGLIAGFKEAASSFFKVLSGYLSDRTDRKKPFVIAGYLISSLFKLTVGLAKSSFQVFWAVLFERLGKGVRTAPRDALISLYGKTGKNFGLHRAMDTAGALLGLLLVIVLINADFENREIIFIAAFISFFSLIPLLAVREPSLLKSPKKEIKERVPKSFWKFLVIASIFAFSSVSFMFLVAIAEKVTNSRLEAVVFYALLNVTYILSTYPAGVISDRVPVQKVTAFGYLVFGISLLVLSKGDSLFFLLVSFLLYGVALGVTDTSQRVLIARVTAAKKRGLAYGLFHGVTGIALIVGNSLAGRLWDVFGLYSFSLFGMTALISALLLFKFNPEKKV